MSSLEPGQQLRCIEADSVNDHTVIVGRVYTCAEVIPAEYFKRLRTNCTVHGRSCSGAGVLLAEINVPPSWFWCSLCFKPVGEGKEPWAEALEKGIPISSFEEPKREPVADKTLVVGRLVILPRRLPT